MNCKIFKPVQRGKQKLPMESEVEALEAAGRELTDQNDQ